MAPRPLRMLRDWDIVLFDAGRTLIRQHPGLCETILAFSDQASLGLSLESAERAAGSARAWAEAQNLREYRGEPYMEHDAFLLGFYAAGLSAVLTARSPAEIRSLAEALYAFSEQIRHWITMPGAKETLDLLRDRGRRAGLVSNFSAALRGILDSQGLTPLLDPLIVSAEVGIEKPDPRIMRLACSRANVEPARAVYVGDHPLDVVCAQAAGVPVVWITDPARDMPPEVGVEPDARAAAITELPALLGLYGGPNRV